MGSALRGERKQGDPWDTRWRKVLLGLRILFFGYVFVILGVGAASIPEYYVIYLTHWGVILALLFFSCSLLALWWTRFSFITRLFFESAWSIEFTITIVFWTWVYPLESDPPPLAYNLSVHMGMLLFLILDYMLNLIYFERKHVFLPLGILLLYSVVNIPVTFTVGEVYPRMDYKNGWSYLVIGYSIFVCVVSFFLGKWLDRFKSDHRKLNASMELIDSPDLSLN